MLLLTTLNELFNRYIRYIIGFLVLAICVVVTGIVIVWIKPQPAAISSTTQTFAEANPIVKRLPYKTTYYTIDYRAADTTTNRMILTIQTEWPVYRYNALLELRSLGIDPTDYQIDFKDFANPLGSPTT